MICTFVGNKVLSYLGLYTYIEGHFLILKLHDLFSLPFHRMLKFRQRLHLERKRLLPLTQKRILRDKFDSTLHKSVFNSCTFYVALYTLKRPATGADPEKNGGFASNDDVKVLKLHKM